MYGTTTVVYPAAAAYFDCEAACEFKDERCGGAVRVRSYSYIERVFLRYRCASLVMSAERRS